MSDMDSFAVLRPFVWALVVPLTTAAVLRMVLNRPAPPRAPDGTGETATMSYSVGWRLLAALCAVMAVGLAVGACLVLWGTKEGWVIVLVPPVLAFGGAAVYETQRVRHRLTSQGIEYRGFRRQQMVPWSELRTVHWDPKGVRFVLTTTAGDKLYFDRVLRSLDVLARMLHEYSAAEPSDERTRRVLDDARRGILPKFRE